MLKSRFLKPIAVVLSILTIAVILPLPASAGEIEYTIVNPYAGVDWDAYGQYKANLHTHSTVSDAGADFAAMVEKHYELGYDVLAMTDHATVDRSWTNLNINPGITFAMNIATFGANPTPLTAERYDEITAGAGRGWRGMLRVPFGIEHNAASFDNTHVNSLFADVGDGYLGGTSYFDGILKSVERAGGISFINHPGDYARANADSPANAYDKSNSRYRYVIDKYANLFKNYDSCLGMEIFNMSDRTCNDRKLWDSLLAEVIPSGRNVFAFANSDAHSLTGADTAWEILCMPENTAANVRECLEDGAFFAGSRVIKNTVELARIEEETGLDLGELWRAEPGTAQPEVKKISVDESANQITVTAVNNQAVHWIADGEVICTGGTIDLNNYSGQIGSYVRAEIWGEGGILYTQPFMLKYIGAPWKDSGFFFDFGVFLNLAERLFYWIVDRSPVLSYLQDLALGG